MSVWLRRILWILTVAAIVILAVLLARPVYDFLNNEQALEIWLDRLGPLGPLGVIALNALQVIVAFIPGYAMQVTAGFLYGFPLGALYGAIGMTLGGVIAMALARRFGQPFVARMVGPRQMARWQEVTRLNSLPIWAFMMIGPFGDVPYYIAGLTRLPIWKIIVLAVLLRTPSVIIAVAIGAGLLDWHSPWVLGGAALVMTLGALVVFNQQRLDRWIEDTVLPRLSRRGTRHDPPPHP
ncbi:MAG: VTT domain-containing protein [Caldilineales bacterium]